MHEKSQWKVYRTRFLVRACQLTEPLTFTDSLGREHAGEPGDYLVETYPGIRRITSQKLFEDIYVPLASSVPVAQNQQEEMFGKERLLKIIRQEAPSGSHALEQKFLEAIEEFTQGMPQTDDITFVAVPNNAPTPAVSAIARAPQNVTRIAPTNTPAPPARAANPPRSARNNSELPETMGITTATGAMAVTTRGSAAPATKLAADANAA